MTWYKIEGINPQPWQAAEGYIGRKGGHNFIGYHSTPQLIAYKEAIRECFHQQNPDDPGDTKMLSGHLDVKFYFWRKLDSGFVVDKRKTRAHVADATNLQKALEDALQGLLFYNDRDNRRIMSEICAQDADTTPFILIWINEFKADPWPVIQRVEMEGGTPAPSRNTRDDINLDDIF